MSFDPVQYMKDANAKEAATRAGTPLPEKPAEKPVEAAVAVAEPPDQEEKKEQEHARLPRSARRELNRLREELGRTKGMLEAFEKMGKAAPVEDKAEPKIDPEAKPERTNYATDAEFTEALGAWGARKELGKAEQNRAFQQRLQDMAQKADEDAKIIPDYQAHLKSAEPGGENAVDFKPDEHPTFMSLIGTSEYQALVADYFCTHPDEFQEMLDLTKKTDKNGHPVEQVAEFRALEGHLKRVYKGLKAKAVEIPEKTSNNSGTETSKIPEPKAVKLPKPSESAATRGGSAPASEVSPYLADGKTLNPLWKEQRNIREGARR